MTNELANAMREVSGGTTNIWTTWAQMGFLGLCLILLSFVGWLVRAVIRQNRETSLVMAQHAVALSSNTEVTRELSATIRSLSDKLAPGRRPGGAFVETPAYSKAQVS
jgi:hypothetical protein